MNKNNKPKISGSWQKQSAVASFGIKKLNGSTLIESLTALAIVTAVMGSAFTIYNQTVSKQSNVMKLRAKFVQSSFEQQLLNGKISEDLSDEYTTVETEETNYKNLSDIKQYTLTIKNKQGKIMIKKNYLKHSPNTHTNFTINN